MFTGFIYKISSPSGRVYIGQTINFKNRLTHHKKLTRPDTKLAKAIIKYGWDNLSKEIIDTIETTTKEDRDKKLNNLEIYYIQLYNSYKNGYNCTTGGDGTVGRNHSKETKQFLRNMNLGKTLSVEHKENISKGLKNNPRIITEETRRKLSASKLGDKNPNYKKVPSEETKLKMSISQTGRHHTQESKDKIANSKKGVKRPAEVMAKSADKKRRIIYQLDLKYNVLKIWAGVNDTMKVTGNYNIGRICRGLKEQTPPYIWMFKEDYESLSN